MSVLQKLFKQTAIYGIATVLPRMLSFFLVPLYTGVLNLEEYGEISLVFSLLILFNVILAYGMETSFFRFYADTKQKKEVISTATISLLMSSVLFLFIGLLFKNSLSEITNINTNYFVYTVWILFLDALVIIPFAKLRATGKPLKYAVVKITNVTINLLLNLFFLLLLPKIAVSNSTIYLQQLYVKNFEIEYVFIANVIASGCTLLLLSSNYFKQKWTFNVVLWKKMLRYGLPIMVAGIAYAINEAFDRLLLNWLLPEATAKASIGAYSACYKLSLFMTLFATAFRLGIEPFFFNYAKEKNATTTYAQITKYFVIFGSFILLFIIASIDVLKLIIIRNNDFLQALKIVPFILLANFFLGIYNNLSVWYKLTDKTKIGAYISIGGAVITLILNFVLIPFIGYMGSAIATFFAYGGMMIISFYLGQKQFPIPYETKKIITYLGIAILLSSLSFYIPILRKTYLFGIVSVFVFTYFVYKNEKETILKLLNKN